MHFYADSNCPPVLQNNDIDIGVRWCMCHGHSYK